MLDLIELLRKQWFNMILTMGLNSDFIKNENCNFVIDDFDSLFKCYNTAGFLWYLFFNEKLPIENNSEYLIKNIDLTKTNIWYFNLNTIFDSKDIYLPEHIWIMIQIKDKFYVLQSFYSAYTMNSDFGFYEIINNQEYFDMITFMYNISLIKNRDYTESEINSLKNYGNIFSKYTHIDYNRWYDRDNYSSNSKNFTVFAYNINNVEQFVLDVKNKLCLNLTKIQHQEIKNKYKLVLYTSYLDIIINKSDVENVNFLDEISELTGLKSKYFTLINMTYITPIQYEIKEEEVKYIILNFTINYNIKNIIEQDMKKSFNC